MDYLRYQIEDFVTDEYFIRWVKSPNEESNAFWLAWISKNPGKKADVQRAREVVLLLDIKERHPPEGKLVEIWEKIIGDEDVRPARIAEPKNPIVIRANRGWYYKVAASLLLICLIGAALFLHRNRTTKVATAYGESRTLFLPDSTKVTLNSNSVLHYSASDFTEEKREVSLDGEAFFVVVPKGNRQNFLVHTNQLDVEVLGTKFDVNTRRGKTRVVLEEGKVKLRVKSPNVRAPLVMQPGELVEFSENGIAPIRKKVDPQDYVSWRNNRLVFLSTPLREIAHMLEDNYGYEVRFENAEISDRKFTGSASSEDVQELFGKLTKVFSLNIEQDSNKLVIKYK